MCYRGGEGASDEEDVRVGLAGHAKTDAQVKRQGTGVSFQHAQPDWQAKAAILIEYDLHTHGAHTFALVLRQDE